MTLLASPVVNRLLLGDNLELMRAEPDESVQMAYLDPPFNTGRDQTRRTLATTVATNGNGDPPGLRPPPLHHPPARGVLLPRRVRRLPRLPRAAAARGAPPPPPHRHPVLPHRLARGPLLQAAARRAVRPRVLPQRADLGLRLRRQAAPPLAAQARHDPRLRQARGRLLLRRRGRRPRALHGARPRDAGEGGAREAADRRHVAHHRLPHGAREDRLPDPET